MHVKFVKLDEYGQAMFCVNKKATTEEEKTSYRKLCNLHRKLAKRDYGTFLPIYADALKEFATLRLRKSPDRPKFKERAIYDVQFTTRVVHREGKDFVNCWYQMASLVKEADPFDPGEELEFSDSDDEEHC